MLGIGWSLVYIGVYWCILDIGCQVYQYILVYIGMHWMLSVSVYIVSIH